jgi:hypothetical protein
MTNMITREPVTETNGDPDHLVEEMTEVLTVEADSSWRVMIEHTSASGLIQTSHDTREEAIAMLDRIEQAFESGEMRLRIDPLHLISLKRFRQAWVVSPQQ